MSEDELHKAMQEDGFSGLFTRRQYLTRKLMLEGANMWLAIEAVSSTAIEHPETDYDEEKTWEEWEAMP